MKSSQILVNAQTGIITAAFRHYADPIFVNYQVIFGQFLPIFPATDRFPVAKKGKYRHNESGFFTIYRGRFPDICSALSKI